MKGFDKVYYLDLIKKAIKEHGTLNRKDIDELLWEKLPGYLTETKKKRKINNLLSELRNKKEIINKGSKTRPSWELAD